jgi:hypothetical protein
MRSVYRDFAIDFGPLYHLSEDPGLRAAVATTERPDGGANSAIARPAFWRDKS